MKKLFRILFLFMMCGLVLILGGSLALGVYYRSNFPVNTWINGVYCTGKTVEQVNEELAAGTELPPLIIQEGDETCWTVDMKDISARVDYTKALKEYLRQNASPFWMVNLDRPSVMEMNAVQYTWDEEKLQKFFWQLSFVQEEGRRLKGVSVRREGDRYFLYDGNTQRLDADKAYSYLKSCLAEGKTFVSLAEGNCYETLQDDAQDREQRALWEQVETFLNRTIIYDMGAEQIALDPGVLGGFLQADETGTLLLEEGRPVPDTEKIAEWVEQLALEYDTCGTTREFQSTRGDVVSVKYVTYGTELDQKAETEYLVKALTEGQEDAGMHVPAYKQQGYARGLDDIGGTYIEVDMTEQHLYYYEEGELKLDTDIVTGNLSTRHGTPEGINFVYSKQRNRILRGPDYASPVKYWMPVKGSIGIHDASWRSKFGGEIYKKNGSHGCVNLPSKIMPDLYDMVELGTPVIMFY